MAYQEGLCGNCGSLIQVSANNEQARCVFCWAQTPREQALELLNSDVSTHNFAQAEIADAPDFAERMNYWRQEVGDNSPVKAQIKHKQTQKQQKQANKEPDVLSAVERLKRQKVDVMQVPRVSWMKRLMVSGFLVVLPILLVVVLTVPSYLAKWQRIEVIRQHSAEIIDKQYLTDKLSVADLLSFPSKDASHIRIVVNKELPVATLQQIGLNYFKVYNNTIGNSTTPTPVVCEIFANSGVHQIVVEKSDQVAVQPLKRTF